MPTKEIYWKNPELHKARKREWYKKNVEKVREYNFTHRESKEYKNINKPSVTKKSWASRGIIPFPGQTYDDLYEIYKNTNECFYCGVSFENIKKNLDHCHTTGLPRGVLCTSCNVTDKLAGMFDE